MAESFSYQEIIKIDDKNVEFEKVFPFEGEMIRFNKKKVVKKKQLENKSNIIFLKPKSS